MEPSSPNEKQQGVVSQGEEKGELRKQLMLLRLQAEKDDLLQSGLYDAAHPIIQALGQHMMLAEHNLL